MIQIVGLRPFYNKKKNKEDTKDVLLATVPDVAWLFKNLDFINKEIPADEQWNCYFTVLDCQDPRLHKGKLRKFKSQDIFPFDIDGMDLSHKERYIETFFEITKFDRAKTVVICSGNGLQFFAQFEQPFTSQEYFADHREQYKNLCHRVDKALAELGLPGKADTTVWSAARIMRLPNTENRKKGKETKRSFYISGELSPQKIDWEALGGLPELAPDDTVSGWSDIKAPQLDHKEIYDKCNFTKESLTPTKDWHEPQFYAALSIIGRMENGLTRALTLRDEIRKTGNGSSVGQFSDAEVEKKLEQALVASGPRTCKGVNQVWGKCKDCPMFNKVVSPVSLKSPEHIATKSTGFHTPTPNGLRPNYMDLLKYFDQVHHHKTLNSNGLVFAWKETHYELLSRHEILGFAQTNFVPYPSSKTCDEFLRLVQRTNLVSTDFLAKDLNGKLNFANGVYNFKTKSLTPHDPSLGFRYCLPYGFDPKAKAPRFEQFLDEVTGGDKNLRSILEEFGGYALSGDEYWIHKTLFLVGDGANGKSTYIDVLKMCAGKGNYSSASLKDLRSENNKQLLEGKLFNVAPELHKDSLKDTEKFKYLSDGSEIIVKLMYNQPYTIKNRAKMIYACNEIPETDETTYGFLRRMVIVPFNQLFDGKANKVDEFIIHKLEQELAGIMNVFIKGYERLLANRRFTDAEHDLALSEKTWYTLENNIVQEFVNQTSEVTVHPLNGRCHFTTVYDLRQKFESWAVDTGVTKEVERMTISRFSRMFQKAIDLGQQRRGIKKIEGKAHRGYWDVELH